MSAVADYYRGADLIAVASDWGYRSDIAVAEPSSPDGQDAILLRGSIATAELPCGRRMCISDLTAKRAHERSGVLGRSLAMMFPIAGEGHAYGSCRGKTVALSPGTCVAIKASDDVALSSAFRKGQRTCGLFLDACPERIADTDLAERITCLLRSTAISATGIDGAMKTCLQRISMTNGVGKHACSICSPQSWIRMIAFHRASVVLPLEMPPALAGCETI